MPEYRTVDLGAVTADADKVTLGFTAGDLTLAFLDWQETPRQLVFREVLGFRWQAFDEGELADKIRDDVTYEVLSSDWLDCQAKLQGERADDYAHYLLCFNAVGTLDVLARRHRQ